MKYPQVLSLGILAAFALASCGDPEEQQPRRGHRPGTYPPRQVESEYPAEQQPFNEDGPRNVPPQNEIAAAPSPTPAPPAGPVQQTKGDIPYGIPVPNKAGFVTSPYAPNQGYVDVRGIPPGTEVKDPYTQKVFLVP